MTIDAGSTIRVGSASETAVVFRDENGVAANPDVVYCNFGLTPVDLESVRPGVTWEFRPPPGPGAVTGNWVYVGPGIIWAAIDSTGLLGPFAARLFSQGAIEESVTLADEIVQPLLSMWPYPFGYCTVNDVRAEINAGTWNPDLDTAFPTATMVNNWIRIASSHIDMRLRTMGFGVPIAPASGVVAVDPQVFVILKDIATQYASGYIERARHGSQDENEDTASAFHFAIADDMLAQIENGDINFRQFGVAGPFMPEPDKSKGILVSGGYDQLIDGQGNPMPTPFSIGMKNSW